MVITEWIDWLEDHMEEGHLLSIEGRDRRFLLRVIGKILTDWETDRLKLIGVIAEATSMLGKLERGKL